MKVKGTGTFELYGYIGVEATASDFLKKLRQLEANETEATLHIHSVGGDVFEGIAMYNHLTRARLNVTVIIDGLAASMATVVMCGGAKIKMVSNAMLMVHGPQGGTFDTVEKLEDVADMIRKLRANMAEVYAKRTGQTEQWVMDNWLADGKDHWFTAEEALRANLIDEIIASEKPAADATMELPRIAAFYSEQLLTKPQLSMKKVIAVLNASKIVSLADASSEELIAEGVNTVMNKLSTTQAALQTKDAEIVRLTAELAALQGSALKDKATALVDGAIQARKIVASQKDNLITLASASEEGYANVKAFLDSVQGYQPVAGQVQLPADFPTKGSELTKLHDLCAKGEKAWADYSDEQIKLIWKAKHSREISASTLKALRAQ